MDPIVFIHRWIADQIGIINIDPSSSFAKSSQLIIIFWDLFCDRSIALDRYDGIDIDVRIRNDVEYLLNVRFKQLIIMQSVIGKP